MNYPCNIVVACTSSGGIGSINPDTGKQCFPWSIPENLYHFKHLTQSSVIIMGRKTYESIPANRRPLKHRINLVITSQNDLLNKPPELSSDNLTYLQYTNWTLLPDILSSLSNYDTFKTMYQEYFKQIFIIGGKQIYETILDNRISYLHCSKIYLTRILSPPEGLYQTIYVECKCFQDTELVETSRMYRYTSTPIQKSIVSNIEFVIEEWKPIHTLFSS
jgi:dihydrofolate reductase